MDPRDRSLRPRSGSPQATGEGFLSRRLKSRRRPALALAGLVACVCLALGAVPLWVAQADQFPELPPPPSPSDNGSGSGNGSPGGYPDASTNQAESLFTTDFSSTVDSLAQDPPDLSGEHPRFLNDHTALISSNGASPADLTGQIQQILNQDQGDLAAARSDLNDLLDQQNGGTPKLVSSTLPLRTLTDTGQPAPVDLSLNSQGSGYVPDNPLVDLKLPANASNDVTVEIRGSKSTSAPRATPAPTRSRAATTSSTTRRRPTPTSSWRR